MNHMSSLSLSPTPANLSITPRDMRFGRDDKQGRWWLNGDPIASAFHTALSVTFPRGEAMFIEAVKAHRDGVDEKLARDAQFRDIFVSRANERQTVVANFQAKVRELGGNPEDDGTVLASAHRAFLGLRDALTGDRDDSAVVAEVERGEDHIKAKFESALKDDDLDPAVRQLIQTGYTSVREGHDQMSALKHQLNAS